MLQYAGYSQEAKENSSLQSKQIACRVTHSSKIDYGDLVYTPLTVVQQKCLQTVQFAAALLVTGDYVRDLKMILKLGWLPIKKRRGTKPPKIDI